MIVAVLSGAEQNPAYRSSGPFYAEVGSAPSVSPRIAAIHLPRERGRMSGFLLTRATVEVARGQAA